MVESENANENIEKIFSAEKRAIKPSHLILIFDARKSAGFSACRKLKVFVHFVKTVFGLKRK